MDARVGRFSRQHGRGFLLAAVLTTLPLLGVTWFLDNLSKDGPIGLPVYLLPGAVGLVAGLLAGAAVLTLGRESADQLGYYAAFGCVASLLLIVNFCAWWGDWSFRVAERFRG